MSSTSTSTRRGDDLSVESFDTAMDEHQSDDRDSPPPPPLVMRSPKSQGSARRYSHSHRLPVKPFQADATRESEKSSRPVADIDGLFPVVSQRQNTQYSNVKTLPVVTDNKPVFTKNKPLHDVSWAFHRSESEQKLHWDLPVSSDPGIENFSEDVSFKFWVFREELFYLCFHPLSIIVCLAVRGVRGTRNRRLLNWDGIRFAAIHVVLWAACLTWLLVPSPNVSAYEILAAVGLAVLRHAVVATKVAYYSSYELDQVNLHPDLPPSFTSARQMLTSWLKPSPLILRRELAKAARRLDIHPGRDIVQFRGNGGVLKLILANAGEAVSESSFSGCCSDKGQMTTRALLTQVVSDGSAVPIEGSAFVTVVVLAALVAFEPLAHRAIFVPEAFREMALHEWAILVAVMLIIFISGGFNMAFIYAASRHYRRKLQQLTDLTSMISEEGYRPKYKHGVTDDDAGKNEVPQVADTVLHLDMTDAQTVSAWFRMREIVDGMGLVYHRRIQSFLAYFLLYTFTMMIALIAMLVVVKVDLSEVDHVLLSLFLLNIGIFIHALSKLSFLGSKVTRTTKRHIHALNRHLIRVHDEHFEKPVESCGTNPSYAPSSGLWLSNQTLTTVIRLLEASSGEVLLGFTSGASFIKSLVTIAVAVAALAIREVL